MVAAVSVGRNVSSDEVERELEARVGRISARSASYDLDSFTSYYAEEMGTGVVKHLVAFEAPLAPDALADAKLAANSLERRWTDDSGRRAANVDPGYVTPHALFLASCKASGHRVYLRDGVYAEVTLRHERGGYRGVPWTYPDFLQPSVLDFLAECRLRAVEFAQDGVDHV